MHLVKWTGFGTLPNCCRHSIDQNRPSTFRFQLTRVIFDDTKAVNSCFLLLVIFFFVLVFSIRCTCPEFLFFFFIDFHWDLQITALRQSVICSCNFCFGLILNLELKCIFFFICYFCLFQLKLVLVSSRIICSCTSFEYSFTMIVNVKVVQSFVCSDYLCKV